jgi:predicted NAD/FAD-binding protein
VLPLLTDPCADEVKVLGNLRYSPNQAYLHRDPSLMPRREKVWSSWNYICGNYEDPELPNATVTYWMNRLQRIDPAYPLFVTLNPETPPAEELTYRHFVYDHPQFDIDALRAQEALPTIQGRNNTWFCGAYAGFGFHEDGLRSGLDAAEQITGTVRPWGDRPICEEARIAPSVK